MNRPLTGSRGLSRTLAWIGLLAGSSVDSRAFDTVGPTWPTGEVAYHINLDGPNSPFIATQLFDRATTWKAVFLDAMAQWNPNLGRIKLVEAPTAPFNPSRGNGKNEVFWANDVYGEALGTGTLGVTLYVFDEKNPLALAETDIIFSLKVSNWNSYRRDLQGTPEFRRVAIHELGHSVGLDHPDEAGQDVVAIMNSFVSDTDNLANDDRMGVSVLYGQTLVMPQLSRAPRSQTVNVGDLVAFDFEIGGILQTSATISDSIGLSWYFPEVNFEGWLFTFQDPDLFIGAAQPYDAGTYTLLLGNADGYVESESILTVNPVTTSAETKMTNLSTRAFAGTGSQTLTVGFVIEGSGPKRVLVRAVGPTLGQPPFNLPGTQANPRLKLMRNGTGEVAANDDWGTNTTAPPAEIAAVTQSVGGFALPAGSKDAAILVDLTPGVYTAQVETATGNEGLVIVEAYDVTPDAGTSRLVNLSTRGQVGSGLNIIVAGLVVAGPAPRTYLIRAVGDTLQDFGIDDYLDDAVITLYRQANGQSIRQRYVDDWDDPAVHQPMLEAAMQRVGAFPLTDRQESALKITLAPGAYTVEVSSFGEQTGVALVEIYEFPE